MKCHLLASPVLTILFKSCFGLSNVNVKGFDMFCGYTNVLCHPTQNHIVLANFKCGQNIEPYYIQESALISGKTYY